jgi:hypothetical protein
VAALVHRDKELSVSLCVFRAPLQEGRREETLRAACMVEQLFLIVGCSISLASPARQAMLCQATAFA